ncbi:MAG TPA: septal ring lytic transglycosylase RlpA family protein [Trueperaceae bacterium]|nr:septal ring lytic transglycosylase RlpA family protein [Trueperaceae bacterium]
MPARVLRSRRFRSPLSRAVLMALLAGVLGACAPAAMRGEAQQAARPGGASRTTAVAAATVARTGAAQQTGMASWYGPGFAGRLTANGEVFDPSQLTAAHKELPFNTLVRVHNVENGDSVVVRINDRGPFKPGRIIDLSRAGAEAIGMIGTGVARVQLEVLTLPDGMLRVGASDRLRGFEVMSRLHPVGSLLVLAPPIGGDQMVVRVVSQDLPIEEPADLLVGYELYAMVGAEVQVHLD